MAGPQGSTPKPLSSEVADRLLDLLASDDAFRELFARDPASALTQAGYTGSREDLALLQSRLKVGAIAPKETIAASRGEIRASLTSGFGMQPVQLNVAAGPRRGTPAHPRADRQHPAQSIRCDVR